MNPWKSYLRWRHSKGYGVHSPYAYRFVKDVLHPGDYGFYAYHDLDYNIHPDDGINHNMINRGRFIIRLIVFLKSKRVVSVNPSINFLKIITLILHIKYSEIHSESELKLQSGDLMISSSGHVPDNILSLAFSEKIPVLVYKPDKTTALRLEQPIERGVLFVGKNKILLIPREEMEYLRYDIKM